MKNKLSFNQWLAVAVSLVAVFVIMFSSFRLSSHFEIPEFFKVQNTSNINVNEENNLMLEENLKPKFPISAGESLEKQDLVVGTGKEALENSRVVVNYEGFLVDGTKFDSSYDRNEPFVFNLGAGEVIVGWDQGVVGMKVGGKRKLVIPPSLGYGSADLGVIPPNSTLVFEIELLKVD